MMNLGTSIFLSALLLGIIGLFIATKDRWNWKKIALWPVAALIAISLIIVFGIWFYTLIDERPRPVAIFWGIPLEATRGDIKYLKGEPTEKHDNNELWVYEYVDSNHKESHIVHFSGDKLKRVTQITSDDAWSTGIQGVFPGSTHDQVTAKFDAPSHVSVSDDELCKYLSFEKYNVFFYLCKNKISFLGMYNPEFGPVKHKKEKQDRKSS